MSKRDKHRRQRRAARFDLAALVDQVLHAATAFPGWSGQGRRAAGRLVASAPGAPFELAANAALMVGLEITWRNGWQPVDVWQVVRRRMDDGAADFVIGAITEESARHAQAASDPRWRAQLAELGATPWWGSEECFVEAYAARERLDQVATLAIVIELLTLLNALPSQAELVPPPGSNGSAPPASDAEEVDPKVLAKVRALLAKAESTDFPDEADAFFAKAQELMSRYSLERAVLYARDDGAGGGSRVRTGGRRIWLDNPYLSAKSMLVGTVASANHCRAVFDSALGFVTVLGERTDVEIVEVLTTSLLVQAGRAMLAAGRQVDRRGQSRTKSFRQSFLVSFAQRIGERLASAAEQAEAEVTESIGDGRLLPVLAAKEEAVQELVDELFPRLTTRRVTVSNSAGWTAGRAAADLAVLDAHRAVRA
ncbi:DUF2786 domain-containing protein [Pseudonocardia acaciae]|uniref:DUF2786 domain-containing protein n=1 Tax=Pseudonocardia acaciae TaxID=551276 RepID=UPI00048FF60E|nr:DUF2786 domain-containing protein [Pseudonocardia acaciae]